MAARQPASATAANTTPPHATDIDKWDDYLAALIDMFEPFLLDNLRVSYLLCLLPLEEVRQCAGSIHEKENSGDYSGASKQLLDAIKNSDEQGKWQMFLDALAQVENTTIVSTLLEEKSCNNEWLSNNANRRLIQIFSQSIEEKLNLNNLLEEMFSQNLIVDRDLNRLRALLIQGKKHEANAVLILLMHRHSANWYDIFMGILCDDDLHFQLAKYIDPEFCNKRKTKQKKEEMPPSVDSVQPPHSFAQHATHQSSRSAGQKHVGDTPSLGGNLGNEKSTKEKIRDKGLPQGGNSHGVKGAQLPPPPFSEEREATCDCQCCAVALTKITSLESDVAEMKAMLRAVLNSRKA